MEKNSERDKEGEMEGWKEDRMKEEVNKPKSCLTPSNQVTCLEMLKEHQTTRVEKNQ